MDGFSPSANGEQPAHSMPEQTAVSQPEEAVPPTGGPPVPPLGWQTPHPGYLPPEWRAPYAGYTSPVKRTYTGIEQVAAVVCAILGYLFIRWVLPMIGGIGVTLFTVLFLSLFIMFIYLSGRKLTPAAWGWAGVVMVFALPPMLYPAGLIRFLNIVFLVLAGGFFVFTATNRHRAFVRRQAVSDAGRALLRRPFSAFSTGAEAIGASVKRLPTGKGLGRVLLGLALGLPIFLIAAALLTQADEGFGNLLQQWFGWIQRYISGHMVEMAVRILFAIPVALYLFGMLYAGLHPEQFERAEQTAPRQGGVPQTVLLSAGIPVCLLYLLFLLTQSTYYFSSFAAYLPEGFTYAGNARQGFFELCGVVVINLGIAAFVWRFSERKQGSDRLPLPLRVYTAVICLFTLLLIATALRKMVLYIDSYGLTPLRVYTSWFMVLLALMFLVLLLYQWQPRLPMAPVLTVIFLIMFGLLQFCPVDGWIARYNVEQYQRGKLETVDVRLFYELSDQAVPHAAKLLEDNDPEVVEEARVYLTNCLIKQRKPMSYNFTTAQAKELLRDLQLQGTIG